MRLKLCKAMHALLFVYHNLFNVIYDYKLIESTALAHSPTVSNRAQHSFDQAPQFVSQHVP